MMEEVFFSYGKKTFLEALFLLHFLLQKTFSYFVVVGYYHSMVQSVSKT